MSIADVSPSASASGSGGMEKAAEDGWAYASAEKRARRVRER
jgi:hypothetical protein